MSSAEQASVPERIGGRYQIEAQLGQGGTARVYRVLDARSGQRLALKKLVQGSSHRGPELQVMFEREYHTLMHLAHPRIVRVFDYGLDEGDPFYTMELLQGGDAREVVRGEPLSVARACTLLRDAASALALIHSRRLVHRDVSPHNLWCTPDGRGTLIDFGTLVAMGPQSRVAGTPPFIAPESLYMQPLEARTDLYSLGALGYYLLTRRYAYPAREIAELRELWRRAPPRPEQIRPELPPALCDLVMALLSIDTRGRPASAAEVYERLSAIAELPADDGRRAAEAFLTSPELVGREAQSAQLQQRLRRALRGRGGVAAIAAPAGLGRSRLLESFVLEAKLTGASVVSLFATAVGSGSLALGGALAERLLDLHPELAAQAASLAGVLGQLSPALRSALGEPALATLTPYDRAPKLTAALVELVELACSRQPLVIAVDDVHRADSASLGLLGRLSTLAAERALLLVTTLEADSLEAPPPALEQLAREHDRVTIFPLEREHTQALLGSLFGSVPGLDDAARWLHELSQGSPQACMQYAQHLVDWGIARYESGGWKLPPRLRDCGLPATLDAMFEARVAALGDDARTLALGLALARDESRSAWQPESYVHIEDFPKLLDGADFARASQAIDELLCAGVLEQRDQFYVLAQRALVDALLRHSETAERRAVHLRLAEVFQVGGGRYTHMSAVQQLQRAGEQEHARDELVRFIDRLSRASMDWGAMRISVTAQCAQAALLSWQREGGSPRDGILLRRLLLLVCSVYDWSLMQHGDAQLERLRLDSGLVDWERTDASLAPLQRVLECLKLAQQRYEQTPEAERGLAPGDALRELGACAMPLSGAAVHSHDVARARALAEALEPLRPLSPLLDLLADMAVLGVQRVTGREIGDALVDCAHRLVGSPLPEVLRMGGAAVNLQIQAVEDARYGRERGFELLDLIVPTTGEDLFLVVHGRFLLHGFAGRAAEAAKLRKRVEVITEDDVWRRNCFLWAEAELCALTGDLIGLGRAVEAIAALAERFPGWQPWLGWARAALHRLRGELGAARAQLDAALELARPGEHRAYVRIAPARAELMLLQGDAEGALDACGSIREAVARCSLDLWAAVAAERIQALALSELERHDEAAASIDRAFGLAERQGFGGLPLALLHEARARVALAARSVDSCTAALAQMRALIASADAPALVNAYESLRERGGRQLELNGLPSPVTLVTANMTDVSSVYSEVRARLSACGLPKQRAQQALELLLEDSRARSGHLFLFGQDGLFPAASAHGVADDALLSQAKQYVESQRVQTKTAALTSSPGTTEVGGSHFTLGATKLVPVLLTDVTDGRSVMLGVGLLAMHEATLRMPRSLLLQALARCLASSGDSVPLPFDG